MICPNCGREIPDGTVCPCTLQQAALSENPALNVVKTVGSSPLFLVMTILFSLSTLFTIFASTGLNDTIYNLYYYAYSAGLDLDTIESVIDVMRSSAVASAVASSVPAILIAVAMWLHFITCRSRQSGAIATAGLTICKVIAYVNMILQCLATLAVLGVGAMVLIVFLLSDSVPLTALAPYTGVDADELLMTIVIIVALFLAFFLFFMILAITYQASIIRMINRTKQVAQTGQPDERVSSYLVGMTYFVAVVSLITGVGALFTGPIGGLSAICRGVAYILMAVLLSRYRKEMNAVVYPPVNPMGGYGYAPQPGYAAPAQNYVPQQPYGQPGPADGFQQPPQQGYDPNQPSQPYDPNQPPPPPAQ